MGAPGSGKSTLLQHFNGLLRADRGRLQLLDMTISSDNDDADAGASGIPGKRINKKRAGKRAKLPELLRKRVGLVFQYPEQQLFEDTVFDDLMYAPLNFEASTEEASAAALDAALMMGINETLWSKSPFQLSSGQMRKTAIAAVLAAKPEILVLDEPTASLDPMSKHELMELLNEQCTVHQRTVIIVTHSLEEVIPYTEHYLVMHEGNVIFQGDAKHLMQQPQLLKQAGLQTPPFFELQQALSAKLPMSQTAGYLSPAQLAAEIKAAWTRQQP